MLLLTFLAALLLSNCGGGGGGGASGGAPATAQWIGTKLLGVASSTTTANGIAADNNGNVYITGSTTGTLNSATLLAGTQDLFLVAYNSIGSKTATKQLGVAGKASSANAIAIDTNNNVYIAGATSGGLDGNALTGFQDLFLIKYDAANNKVFSKQLGASAKITVATSMFPAIPRAGLTATRSPDLKTSLS